MIAIPSSRPRPDQSRGRRLGIAAVEFALVAPLLFALLLGIIEFGRAMMVTELLNSAARHGARVAAIQGTSTSSVTGAVNSALGGTGVQGAATTVAVNGTNEDAEAAQTGDAITVTVTVPYDSVSWLPTSLFLENSTLSTAVAMRRE
jgi:Flp pilus assembly protein TadG